MKVIIGSARIDENKKTSGGKAGDQKQKSSPDYSGEVSLQDFYLSSKGWNVIRAKNPEYAEKIGDLMMLACNNINLGYSQSDRYGVVKNGVRATSPTNCDCSSLVRAIVKEATGKDPGDFNTSNEVQTLLCTGMFTTHGFVNESSLKKGDILVTKSKGHTAIVVTSNTVVSHTPMSYLNNHIYTVCVDNLNVRTKNTIENISSIATSPTSRRINTGTRITCIKTESVDNTIWIYMGINSQGKEEWVCADSGSKSYVK